MAPSQEDSHVYARLMKNVGGHAFWKKVSATEVRPGACGYFDSSGDWTPIIQVLEPKKPPEEVNPITAIKDQVQTAQRWVSAFWKTTNPVAPAEAETQPANPPAAQAQEPAAAAGGDPVSTLTPLELAGYSAFPTVPKTTIELDPGTMEWPLKHSDSVRFVKYQARAAVNVPTVPVGAGFDAVYQSFKSEGAALAVEGNIEHHQARPTSTFRTWMTPANAAKIMELYPDTKEKGIWIITKTYVAQRRKVILMKSRGSQMSCSVGVRVANVAEIRPSAEFFQGGSQGGWELQEDLENGLVLSASGIWFRPTRHSVKPIEDPTKQKWLGPVEETAPLWVEVPEPEAEAGVAHFHLKDEIFGEVEEDDETHHELVSPIAGRKETKFKADDGFSVDDDFDV